MTKYLLKRILRGLLSIVAVVAIVMVLIYSLLDRKLIFAQDPLFTRMANNQKTAYMNRKWEEYGYTDYVTYADWLIDLTKNGELDEETRSAAVAFGKTEKNDSKIVKEYVEKFRQYYESQGYTVTRLDAIMQTKNKYAPGGQQQLFATRDRPLLSRMLSYFGGLFTVDSVHKVQEDVGERGLSFTLYDPVYGGEKFSPAVIGNGTHHKYLLYFDSQFPYLHQNILQLNLGTSYSVNQGQDVFYTMNCSQGSFEKMTVTYPSGLREESADDLHSATFSAGSRESNPVLAERYTDDYTSVTTMKNGLSKVGYSFVIGVLAVLMAYLLGIPLGILMARHKDKFLDKLGTIYIVFIIAVPSLAYIFLFKAVGGELGLPTTFQIDSDNKLMFVLPIVSLALPSVANLMKWLRRYMIDQMNSDYVKFARSGGLSEGEIFRKHILKNAAIPLIHGIPGSVLGALTGAIITERVYVVPGAGNLLTEAINKYDNGVIVGVTMFYAVLSVISIILGDILMSMADPRISFSSKGR